MIVFQLTDNLNGNTARVQRLNNSQWYEVEIVDSYGDYISGTLTEVKQYAIQYALDHISART